MRALISFSSLLSAAICRFTSPLSTFDNGIATINTETCEALGLDLDTVKKAFEPYCTEVVEVTTAENFG